MSGNLRYRIIEHKNKLVSGFTKRYNLTKLVYYECIDDVDAAAEREFQIKKWRREKKLALIRTMNRKLRDLSAEV